jgi:lipopolysaccharide transport system permease protein
LDRESAPARRRYPVRAWRGLLTLIAARELLLTLTERDLRVRYKQAVLGAFWAIAQPLIWMVLFTLVFGHIAHTGSDGLPYPIFSYTALVPWGLFSGAVTYGLTSVITNQGVVRKIALPREIFPVSAVLSAMVDFGVSCLILFAMLLAFGFGPTETWLAFPVLLLILLLITTALTLVVSAMTVYFRDTRYGVPMLLQILLFATPIAYPLSKFTGPDGALSGWWATAYPYLNPLAPIMDGFRRCLALDAWPQWLPLTSAALVGSIGLWLSYWWYKRLDRTFADVI